MHFIQWLPSKSPWSLCRELCSVIVVNQIRIFKNIYNKCIRLLAKSSSSVLPIQRSYLLPPSIPIANTKQPSKNNKISPLSLAALVALFDLYSKKRLPSCTTGGPHVVKVIRNSTLPLTPPQNKSINSQKFIYTLCVQSIRTYTHTYNYHRGAQ